MRRWECVVCGARDDVRMGLVEWLEPQDGQVWTSLPRCIERQACRDRVEATGDAWPLRDGTRPSAKPMPTGQPAPAVAELVEEAASWFD